MREIKFRALKDDMSNYTWVYGYLTYAVNGVPRIQMPNILGLHTTCIKGTEGQFTGLYDKKRTEEFPNGQPIYEGDVVEWEDSINEEYYGGYITYPKEPVEFKGGAFYPVCMMPETEFEVIGNIHQNKELL